jgi:hypothetical protein
VGARPLVGWSFHPSANNALRQWVVFLISSGSAGNYSVNSVVLRYHGGTQRFETQLVGLDLQSATDAEWTNRSVSTGADLDPVAARLNARPRMTLEYQTPAAVLAAIVASTP